MSQQPVIDTLAFVRDSGFLEREVAVSRLERLQDQLVSDEGVVSYSLRGCKGERNQPQLHLQASGVLYLRCQRCLEAVPFELDVDSLLELVREEGELSQEDLEDDGKDYLPISESLDVVELVEDEILLALPLIPRHEVCGLPTGGQAGEQQSPFALLAGLRGKLN